MTATHSRLRNGAVLAVMLGVLAGLAGGPAATAIWAVPLSVTGTATSGTVAVSATVVARDAEITNDDYQTTHVVTVINAQPPTTNFSGTSDLTLAVRAVPATGLGARMSAAVWPVTATTACTDTSEPPAGYQSAPFTTGLVTAPVAALPGASATFCVRGYPTSATPSPTAPPLAQNRAVVISELGVSYATSATGRQSFTPSYAGAVHRGNFTQQTNATGETTISTSLIYLSANVTGYPLLLGRSVAPAGTCWDVEAGHSTSPPGLSLIAWAGTCATQTAVNRNQRFIHIGAGGSSAIRIRADSTVVGNGYLEANEAGTLVQTQVDNFSELRQIWIGQITGSGIRFQYVNAATGLCMQAPAAAGGAFATAPCAMNDRFYMNWFIAVAAAEGTP